MTTSMQVHGKVILFSNHGDAATVNVALDPDHEGNANLVQPQEGEAGGSPYISFKVGPEDIDRPELREGSDVTLTFAAAKDAAQGDAAAAPADPANKPKSSAAK